MQKSHLELLNISIEKTAHTSVSLISGDVQIMEKAEAMKKLCKYSKFAQAAKNCYEKENKKIGFSKSVLKDAMEKITSNGAKIISENVSSLGYWAYFFDIQDIDEVWRNMVSAYAIDRKFGEASCFEIRTCSGGVSNNRAFDVQSEAQRGR